MLSAWLSWLSTGLSRRRSWVQLRPDQHAGSLNNWGECAAFVITYICKWLDSLVFSDKDDKPEVPSHNPSMFIILWDVKEPAHLSQREGHVVPGVVVCLLWCIMVGRVLNKCSEILATPSYSKNLRVNKPVRKFVAWVSEIRARFGP